MRQILLILITIQLSAQEIKWNSVPYDAINPDELLTKGVIELDNGDKTPVADLIVDFILPFNHNDCEKLEIDLSTSNQTKWIWDKKGFLHKN